ncbi:MAG: hypothetical protein AB1758_10255, partial [Candidatus Eremiobacterota bacterium]
MAVAILAVAVGALGLWGCRKLAALPGPAYRVAPYKLPVVSPAADQDIEFYQKRLALNPDGFLDRSALAAAYLFKARETREGSYYLLAERTARESLQKMPHLNPQAELVLAEVDVARHKFASGLGRARRVLAEDPAQDSAVSVCITALLALGQVEEAGRLADGLAARCPGMSASLLQARTMVARGRDDEAVVLLWKVILREQAGEVSASLRARALLARAYARRGRLSIAEGLCEEILKVRAGHPEALAEMGRLDLARGRFRSAYDRFVAAYQATGDASALMGAARALEGMDQPREAGETLAQAEAALRRELESSFGHRRGLAALLLARGQENEAARLMEEELKVRRDFETLVTAARAHHALGRDREAWTLLQEALATGHREATALWLASQVAARLGHAN